MVAPSEVPKDQPIDEAEIEQRLLYLSHGRKDTPFDTFLRYTDQKEKAGQLLAEMMASENGDSLRMLDIGTGEGELHAQILTSIHRKWPYMKFEVTFIEPKPNHRDNIKGMIKLAQTFLVGGYRGQITDEGTWEEALPVLEGQTFDRILCAHTIYHFPIEQFENYFLGMTQLLSEKGRLYIVARRKDEVYDFIHTFFEAATGRPFNEITIDNARAALVSVAEQEQLAMQEKISHAQVTIPFKSSPEEAKQIVGFYLRKPWDEIDEETQAKIREYLGEGNAVLQQQDGIIELSKKRV